MADRMTMKEIQDKYPDQWVGLVEVEWEPDNDASIKSAVVKYTDKPKSELTRMMLRGEIISRYTTPDNAFQLGITMPERLTWKEIQDRYPDQWVALEDVKYLDDDGCNVEFAVVVCAMSDEEYISSRVKFMQDGKDFKYRRTEDMRGFVGVTI